MPWIRPLLPFVALAFVAAIEFVVGSGAPARAEEVSGVFRIVQSGLLYTYHPLTGTESLFDLQEDPRCLRNLVSVRAEDARRLRDALCRDMGLADIRELRDASDSTLRRLRSLGYL